MLSRKLIFSFMAVFVLLSFSFVVSVEADSLMWSQTYGGTGNDMALSLVATSDGGYAVAGSTRSFGAGEPNEWGLIPSNMWLVKTDEYGDMEWNRTYGGPSMEQAYSVIATSDGGYAIAGQKDGDFWLVKTDEYGVVPEYSSWVLLSIMLVATFVIVIYKKRLLNPRS